MFYNESYIWCFYRFIQFSLICVSFVARWISPVYFFIRVVFICVVGFATEFVWIKTQHRFTHASKYTNDPLSQSKHELIVFNEFETQIHSLSIVAILAVPWVLNVVVIEPYVSVQFIQLFIVCKQKLKLFYDK